MTLKHRLKRIEEKIKPPEQKTKVWLIRTNYGLDNLKNGKDSYFEGLSFKDLDDKKKTKAIIQEIKSGNVQHKDGTYYQEGDSFILLSRIFTDKKPDEIDEREPVHSFDFDTNYEKEDELTDEDMEARISALEQRKIELERKITEGEKCGE